jgi:flagellar biosynthetic protein FlhB
MPQAQDQERTEPATPKKREDSRRRGQVAQSREIPSVLILFCAMGVFFFWGSWMFGRMTTLMGGIFATAGVFEMQIASTSDLAARVFEQALFVLAPLMIAALFAGVSGNVAQFGFLFTHEPLVPKFNKLNPINGLKKLFALRSLVELAKSVLKVVIIGGVAFLTLRGEMDTFPTLIHMGVVEILTYTGNLALRVCFFTCLTLIVLAALDYGFQRWQYEKDLRMTKQEVKEELKQREGDPTVKARIKRAQIEMAQRRMMNDVPRADVIITNPTHLAIALQFDAQKMIAPKVLAKGAGHIAERIKAIAHDHHIPVMEQKPLAQALFKAVEIGEYIPAELYRAVAEVLAYVYRLRGIHKVG